MTDSPTTICVNCRHCVHKYDGDGTHGPDPMTWFYFYCHALQPAIWTDPVTGIEKRDDWPFCRNINTGDCPHYEEEA